MLVDGRPLVFYHYHSLRLYSGITLLRRLGLCARRIASPARGTPLVWASGYPISDRSGRSSGSRISRGSAPPCSSCARIKPRLRRRLHPRRRHALRARGAARRRRRASWRVRGALARRPRRPSAPAPSNHIRELAERRRRPPDERPDRAGARETRSRCLRSAPSSRLMTRAGRGLPPCRARALLDFGCGVGHYSRAVRRATPRTASSTPAATLQQRWSTSARDAAARHDVRRQRPLRQRRSISTRFDVIVRRRARGRPRASTSARSTSCSPPALRTCCCTGSA